MQRGPQTLAAFAILCICVSTGRPAFAHDTFQVSHCARSDYTAVAVPFSQPDYRPRLWVIYRAARDGDAEVLSVALDDQPLSLTCAADRLFLRYRERAESRDVRAPDLTPTPLVTGKIPKVSDQTRGLLKEGRIYETRTPGLQLAYTKASSRLRSGEPTGAVALFAVTGKGMLILFSTSWTTVTVSH